MSSGEPGSRSKPWGAVLLGAADSRRSNRIRQRRQFRAALHSQNPQKEWRVNRVRQLQCQKRERSAHGQFLPRKKPAGEILLTDLEIACQHALSWSHKQAWSGLGGGNGASQHHPTAVSLASDAKADLPCNMLYTHDTTDIVPEIELVERSDVLAKPYMFLSSQVSHLQWASHNNARHVHVPPPSFLSHRPLPRVPCIANAAGWSPSMNFLLAGGK